MTLKHLMEISQENRGYWNALIRSRYEWKCQVETKALKKELREEVQVHGIEKVLDQIIKEYRVMGREEGAINTAQDIAWYMLQKGLEVSEISEVTGLPIPEIEKLNGKTAD